MDEEQLGFVRLRAAAWLWLSTCFYNFYHWQVQSCKSDKIGTQNLTTGGKHYSSSLWQLCTPPINALW